MASTARDPVPPTTTTATTPATTNTDITTTTTTTDTDTDADDDVPVPDGPLFSPTLISPAVAAALPTGYTLRPLQASDYDAGFLSVLAVLTTIGPISRRAWRARYAWIAARADSYFVLVVLDTRGKVVGTGAVLVERKFIRGLGSVGHIEDIAVAKDQQGKKLGLRMIEALQFVARAVGCYKAILDCSEANEGFYVKCGFKRVGLEMACYYG